MRQSLGFLMARPEKLLVQFVGYLDQQQATTITTEPALASAVLPGRGPSWHAPFLRLVVRGLATWLATIDSATQIPPAGLISDRKPRPTPYLYIDDKATALISAAGSLRPPLRQTTYPTRIRFCGIHCEQRLARARRDRIQPRTHHHQR